MNLPEEIQAELEQLAGGNSIAIVVADPESGRHFIQPINLSLTACKQSGKLYLEWITDKGNVRTVTVD